MRLYIFFSFLAFTIQLQAQSAKRMYPIYNEQFAQISKVQDSLLDLFDYRKRLVINKNSSLQRNFLKTESSQKETSLNMNAELDSLKQLYLFLTGANHEIRFRRKFSIYGQMDTVRTDLKQIQLKIDTATANSKTTKVLMSLEYMNVRKVKVKNKMLLEVGESIKSNNLKIQADLEELNAIDSELDRIKQLHFRLEDSVYLWKYRFQMINHEVSEDINQLRSNFEQKGPNGFSNNYFVVFPDVHKKPEVKQNKKPKKGEVLLRDEELVIQSNETFGTEGPASEFLYSETPLPISVDENMVYKYVDEQAEFPGGIDSLKAFIARNLKYPPTAMTAKIQGNVYYELEIDKNGAIRNVRIVRPLVNCPECTEAVKELVAIMPKWRPGRIDGKNVNSYYVSFVKFKLD